jgi:ATP-dependent helicase/nuclease subunit A
MAVDAAAGSGKTWVLVERILKIVGSDWARLSEILAITFTEKAAGEFRAKLRPHVPASERFRLDSAWIGTFHSFCARLIRRFGPAIGLDPSFRMLDENAAGMESRKAVRETLLKLLEDEDEDAASLAWEVGYQAAAGCLEELMSFRWHASQALSQREGASEEESELIDRLTNVFESVRKNYLARLAEQGALDFQELEIQALALLGDKRVANSARGIFSHILVDEYQDTNDIQTELVLRLFDPKRNRLFIVGDEAQSIYRFRGANVSCFAKVRGMIEERRGEAVRLAHNFRSRASIISFVNASQGILADGLFSDPSSPKPMKATKKDGVQAAVTELAVPTGEDTRAAALREREAAAIAQTIADNVDGGKWEYGDVVLLFRSMGAAEIYEATLRRRRIPSSSIGGRGFLKRTEVADLLATLRYAKDPDDRVALLTLLRSPIASLSDDDLAMMAGDDGYGLPSSIARDERLALINELPSMAEHMRPSEILRRVINEAGLELLWAGLDRSGAAIANMDRLVTIARDLEREVPTTLTDFIYYMREMRERGARMGEVPPENAEGGSVRLMTVHAAKGLEFPVVFLPDLARRAPARNKQWIFSRGDSEMPGGVAFKERDPAKPFGSRVATERFKRLAGDEATRDAMESKRLLYVAMTRAIDSLVIPTHEGIKDRGTWHDWLKEAIASEGVKKSIPKKTRARKSGAEGLDSVDAYRPEAYSGGSAMRLSVSQLDSYSVCPMQYYLKYVLGLPASEVTRDEPERLEPNVYGSIVHAMLARATTDEDELASAARSECLAQGVSAGEKRMKEFIRDAREAIRLAGPKEIARGARELPFEIRAGESTISGTIDWLKPVRGGLEIVDYKTGTEKRTKLQSKAEQYEIQMQAYSLAAEQIAGKEVVATALVFPAAGEIVRREMTPARRRTAHDNIEAIVAGIEARDYEIKVKPPCEGCIYKRNGMCWERRTKRMKIKD